MSKRAAAELEADPESGSESEAPTEYEEPEPDSLDAIIEDFACDIRQATLRLGLMRDRWLIPICRRDGEITKRARGLKGAATEEAKAERGELIKTQKRLHKQIESFEQVFYILEHAADDCGAWQRGESPYKKPKIK